MKININNVLQIEELCNKFSNRVISARTAYKFAKLTKVVSEEANFYREQYILYLNEFGEKNENGNFSMDDKGNIKIIFGSEQKCKEKFEELNRFEVELPDIKFTLDELENLEMTAKDMLILDLFIEE